MCVEQSTLDGKPHAHSRFLILCQRFGMSESALEAWMKLHVQVEQAIVMWLTLSLVSLALHAYLLAGAPTVGVYMYVFRVPIAYCLVQRAFATWAVWRHGQPFCGTVAFKIMLLPLGACFMCFTLAGFLCPTGSVPFGSTVQFTVVYAFFVCTITGVPFIVPMALPSEPCRGVMNVPLSALMQALRSIDTLTDLAFVRVLAVQVRARLLLLLLLVTLNL